MLKKICIGVSALVVLTACDQSVEEPKESANGMESSAIIYEGARLITGDGSNPIEFSAFVVDEGSFTLVGSAAAMTFPADANRVDLSGKTVMPAIIDTHTHLNTTREELITDLKNRAYFGVGAALSLGADGEGSAINIREEVIPGAARYRTAGLGITSPEPGRREVHWVTTEEQAREAVQKEVAREVDVIKIWVDDRDGQFERLPPEIYSAVIDEAHKNNLKVSAHIYALEDAKSLLRAGVDMFAHSIRDKQVDAEFIELVKQHPNTFLIANLAPRGVATDLSFLASTMSSEDLVALEQQFSTSNPVSAAWFEIQSHNLDLLNKEGMPIALGTDGNTPWIPHVEMEDMVAAGMTSKQVIVAATKNAAEAIGLADMGTIEAGKSADFIVLDANPIDDITNTRKISAVYLRGEEVNRNQ